MSDRKAMLSLAAGTVSVAMTDRGDGPAYLLLHGGAGPASLAGLAERLSHNGRAVLPTHAGFNREPRPDWFATAGDLASAYLAVIEELGLKRVVLVGNSFGGWIAAEMALRNSRNVAGLVLLNAVGIDTGSDKVIVDPLKVAPADRAALSFHDPAKSPFGVPSPEQLAVMIENQKTLRVYAGEALYDTSLYSRLRGITLSTQVLWGESDRIVGADYGQRWASGISGARFQGIPKAGHFPQIEQLDEVARLIEAFRAGL